MRFLFPLGESPFGGSMDPEHPQSAGGIPLHPPVARTKVCATNKKRTHLDYGCVFLFYFYFIFFSCMITLILVKRTALLGTSTRKFQPAISAVPTSGTNLVM